MLQECDRGGGGGGGVGVGGSPGTNNAALGVQTSRLFGVPLLGFHCSPSLQQALRLSLRRHTHRHIDTDTQTDRHTLCVHSCTRLHATLCSGSMSRKSAGLFMYMMHSLNSTWQVCYAKVAFRSKQGCDVVKSSFSGFSPGRCRGCVG